MLLRFLACQPESVAETTCAEPLTWHADADGDGYGDPAQPLAACELPAGYAANSFDCEDRNANARPGMIEVCDDGADNDCDGTASPCGFYDASLSDADAVWTGEAGRNWAGTVVSGGGDVDGDGFDDVLIGAPLGSFAWGYQAGGVWLVRGSSTPQPGSLLESLRWAGESAADYAGRGGAIVGDVDADGFADFVIVASGSDLAGDGGGAVFLVRGGEALTGGTTANADWWFAADDVNYNVRGTAAAAGDLDDDGFSDVLFAGYSATDYHPVAWVRWGDGTTTRLDGPGRYGDDGFPAAGVGDVDGDGGDDVLVGHSGYGDGGAAWLVRGGSVFAGGEVGDIATARYDGTTATADVGEHVDGAGDVNGDGYADLLIDSWGSTFIVLGRATPGSGSLVDADGILTARSGRMFGGAAGAGDLDEDGHADVLIGADDESLWNGVWILRGSPVVPTGDLDDAGAFLAGETGSDLAGYALDGAGDFNGDGRLDVLIGAPAGDRPDHDAGAAYLVLGHGI